MPTSCFPWTHGPMDKASACGAGDCRFESCRVHFARPYLAKLYTAGGSTKHSLHLSSLWHFWDCCFAPCASFFGFCLETADAQSQSNSGYSSVGRASDCRFCRNQMVPGSIPGGRIFVHHERSESTARCVGRGRKMFAAVVCVSRWLRKIVIQEVRFFPAGSARFVFVWIPKVLREFEETKTTKNKADDIYG